MNQIVADKKRQAIHVLEGFSYQIWQSLFHWLSLGESDALFLEGGEDIDHHKSDGSVETISVKAGAGTLTLRSNDILETIKNFWQHRKNNPTIKVRLRFLSIAERGTERPNPFGKVKGLDLWDSCKHPDTDIRLLRDYLSGEEQLPQDLLGFITNTTDEDLRQHLLIPIEWDTGNKSLPFIKDTVERKVSDYGDRVFNLSHSESIKAIPHLLQQVWEVAKQHTNRRLDLSDFRREFEEAMTERITRPERQKLEWAAASATLGLSNQSEKGASPGIFEALRSAHNERLVQRKNLAVGLSGKLNPTGLIVLKGSTGMGKSTLANSVASVNTGNWRVLDLRGVEPEEIKNKLLEASYLLEDSREQIDCIIDDLNFDQRPSIYENALARLIYVVKLNHGRLIITTQGMLPSRIISPYDIDSLSIIDVPLLLPEEVTELVSNHGCPSGTKLDGWSQITFVSTQGHPQLAHACVKNQEIKGWNQPTFNDSINSPGIDEIRREIRQRLREQLSSDKAKDLLYRLSIFTKRFERTQALYLGNLQPKIEMPGEVFDSLVGPWIEQVADKQFRLSPLLGNTAGEVFSKQDLLKLHCAAADSFIDLKTIDTFGLEALLTHGLAARYKKSLGTAAMAIFREEDIPWKELGTTLSWFGMVKLGESERLFEEDLLLSTLLRRLQFRIAAESKPELAIKVATVWEQEVRQLTNDELVTEGSQSSLLMFLFEVTSADQIPFPLNTFVNYLREQYLLCKNFPEIFTEGMENSEALRVPYPTLANPRLFLFLAAKHCQGAADVVELIALLDQFSGEDAEEFWQLLRDNDNQAMLLINRGWLEETRADAPDWQKYLEILSKSEAIAIKRNAIALITAIYRVRAIVLKEYCNDREAALKALDDGERLIGCPQLFLQEYRAKIYFLEDQYNEALAIWNYVLPALEKENNEARIFSYRDAAMCAVKLGYWAEVADLFRRGAKAAKLSFNDLPNDLKFQPDHTIEYCFKAEYAFALWKAGALRAAVSELAMLINVYSNVPTVEENLKFHLLYRRIGHAVGWISFELNGGQELAEPQSGWFTQQEVGDAIINELSKSPIPPLTQLWHLLARMEYKLSIGDSIFKRFESEYLKFPVQAVKMSYHDLCLRHSLKALKADDLVADNIRIQAELRVLAEQQAEKYSWSEAEELKRVLFIALIRFLCAGQKKVIPINKWKQEVEKLAHLKNEVNQWLDFVEIQLEADVDNLIPMLLDGNANRDQRVLAALLITISDEYLPETEFYANTLLVDSDYIGHWLDVVETDLANSISRKWENIVEHQKFALFSPRTTCPAILLACRDESREGLKKIAAILLAASSAVQTRISDSVRNKLQQLAE